MKKLTIFSAFILLFTSITPLHAESITQENVLDCPVPPGWNKVSFPYKASYIHRIPYGEGEGITISVDNQGLYAYSPYINQDSLNQSELVFYGKISGNAIGNNFTELAKRNFQSFQNAIKDLNFIEFSPEFSLDHYNPWTQSISAAISSGTCTMNGKEGLWYFSVKGFHYPNGRLEMLLVISFKRDPLELFDEVAPLLFE